MKIIFKKLISIFFYSYDIFDSFRIPSWMRPSSGVCQITFLAHAAFAQIHAVVQENTVPIYYV